MSIKTFPLILQETRMISRNTKHLAFKREDGQILDFIPGQFISIHFMSQDKLLRRSYSIASIKGQTDLIELALTYYPGGPASEFLFSLKPGDKVDASGPYGRLVLRDEQPPRYILVATGTGVTPYRAMLPELVARMQADQQLQVILLLGVQTREDLLYVNDFLKIKQEHPRFDFRVHYSRETAQDLQPHEHKGYVQTAFESLSLDPHADIIYLCGNPNMIDSAVDLLKEKGFAIQSVRREKYVS